MSHSISLMGVTFTIDGCQMGPFAVQPADDTLCREQSHLGVVRDATRRPCPLRVVGWAMLTESTPDLGEPHELHRRAQGITHGSTQDASAYA